VSAYQRDWLKNYVRARHGLMMASAKDIEDIRVQRFIDSATRAGLITEKPDGTVTIRATREQMIEHGLSPQEADQMAQNAGGWD
jgi:hypothetical protein